MTDDGLSNAIESAAAEAPYQPFVDWEGEIAVAMLRVLTHRLGSEFAEEVRLELVAKATRWRKSDDEEERQDAPLMEELVNHPFWSELGATSSHQG